MSLIEILIVLAIVSIAAGATILSIGAAGRGSDAQTEARRLASHLSLAADEAIVGNRTIAFVWDESGYQFLIAAPEGGEWVAAEAAGLGTRHELDVRVTSEDAAAAGTLLITPNGDGDSAIFTLGRSDQLWRVEMDGLSATAIAVGT